MAHGRVFMRSVRAVNLDLPGLDLIALASHLRQHVPDLGLDLDALRGDAMTGGNSNLTFRVTDGVRSVIVRRPPLGHVLASAHDMGRECRVMDALRRTNVPVPRVLHHWETPDVLGAPFCLMEDVAGVPHRHRTQLEALGPDRSRRLSERMVQTLADLHEVIPEAVGLGTFGRPEGYLDRQVKVWNRQLGASRSRDLPGIEELYEWLRRHVPATSRAELVHGDYRLDNLLMDHEDRVAAVIDWEMATLGDGLMDLALLVVYSRVVALGLGERTADASDAPGFLSESQIIETYMSARRLEGADLQFHVALAHFKLAVILEGIGHLLPPLPRTGCERLARGPRCRCRTDRSYRAPTHRKVKHAWTSSSMPPPA